MLGRKRKSFILAFGIILATIWIITILRAVNTKPELSNQVNNHQDNHLNAAKDQDHGDEQDLQQNHVHDHDDNQKQNQQANKGHKKDDHHENLPHGNAPMKLLSRTAFQPTVPDNLVHNAPGENGKPVSVPKKFQAESQRLFNRNKFNQWASDKMSLHRTLPDARPKM